MSAAVAVEIIQALNTILQFARDNGVSSRLLLSEYLAARAEGRELTVADIADAKRRAREALDAIQRTVKDSQ